MILLNGSPVPVTIFPDKTSQVWHLPEEILKQSNYAHITWEFEAEAEFMHLAQLKRLLDNTGNFTCDLVLPYLPYGRQDKRISNNETFALHVFTTLLESLNFRSITIIDPHNATFVDLTLSGLKIQYPTDKVYTALLSTESTLVCYPDKGAIEKYGKIYDFVPIYGEKVRDQATGKILSYRVIGSPEGQNVLIIDDICDGGATFLLLAKELYAKGAKEVNLFVSHGLFTNGLKPILDSGIKRIFTKNGEATTIA